MRKQILVFLAIAALFFASSADLWAQGKGKGQGGQKSTVDRQKAGRNQRAQRRAPDRNRKREKKSLSRANLKSRAFGKLQSITAMDSRQLQSLYESSSARNFGQFTSAIMVSEKLGLDRNQVLQGLHDQSLGQVLRNLGVDRRKAKAAMKEVREALKQDRKGKGKRKTAQ
ncbi:hypothetical protein MYX78_04155 [Acidobacteria bacterium AH-259-G07]|nr:hypothetical protein [Acidobacteria bacterium AH-259-G07]